MANYTDAILRIASVDGEYIRLPYPILFIHTSFAAAIMTTAKTMFHPLGLGENYETGRYSIDMLQDSRYYKNK
jgi:hypothetical protein